MSRVISTTPAACGPGRSSAKQGFCRLAAALLAAAGLGGGASIPAEAQTGDDSARYSVTFQGAWTASSVQGFFTVGGAHFTDLIGAVHNSNVTFWRPGGSASPGVEQVAETGTITTFRNSEIQPHVGSAVASIIQQSGTGATGSRTFEIQVTRGHPLVTLLSMIGPSPDWFVGVSGLSLLDTGGQWRSPHSVSLYPYDAGTEDGDRFSLDNFDTDPRGTITSIRGTAPFTDTPMATLRFVRQDPPPTIPTVTAITRQMPAAARTRNDLLIWEVDFSEAVTGVDATDFEVAGTTADVTAVDGSGATWWVTVSGGDLDDLDGEVSLRFASGQDIQNSAGGRLDPALPSGASYQTFTLDNTAPAATIGPATAGSSPFTVTIRFDEPVTGLSLSDITVTNGSAANLNGSGMAYTATVTPANADAPATITVTVAPGAAQDLAGNPNEMATHGIDYAPDTPPPPPPPPPPPAGIAIDMADARASEGEPVTFTVTLEGGTSGRDLELVATPSSESGDTATAGTDYATAERNLSIPAGQTSATFSVATTRDRDDESDETFTVTLSARPGTTLPAGVRIRDGTATGTIVNDNRVVHYIPWFAPASNPLGRQSFARIINDSDEAGEVRIDAFDDVGTQYGPLTLSIGANETAHFNSDDLERGNPAKRLAGATGAGEGRWRLALTSGLDLQVLGYLRTDDRFVTSVHDLVPRTEAGHHDVVFFNPGSNTSQVSRLRLINRGAESAEVTIEGIDDDGKSPGAAVRLSVPASGARTVTAQELESEAARGEALRDLTGALGDGAGKWRLVVRSDRPIEVMSLLASPTGHLTNLSTVPAAAEPGD